MRFSVLATLCSFCFLLGSGSAEDNLTALLEQTAIITESGFDWEWILIRINSLEGDLAGVDFFTAADAQVVVTALDAVEPKVEFDQPISRFESIVEDSTDSPEW